MNSIKSLRKETGLLQKEFGYAFCIPIGTIRNWEQGLSNPPEYVLNMMYEIWKNDKCYMILNIKNKDPEGFNSLKYDFLLKEWGMWL